MRQCRRRIVVEADEEEKNKEADTDVELTDTVSREYMIQRGGRGRGLGTG